MNRCTAHFRRLPCPRCADERAAESSAAIADDFRRVLGMAESPQAEAAARAEFGDGDGFTPAQWEHIEDRIQSALSTERHRIRTLLLEVAAKFGGPVGKALEEVAGRWG